MISPHVTDVCKIGQEANCCKYLIMGHLGFECGKLLLGIKAALDLQTDMVAKSDNCEGKSGVL